MVTRARTYKKKPRKYYPRKRRTRKIKKRIPFGLPNQYVCKLRYREQMTLNPLAAAIDSYTYAATGLYDPNITGGGHQPYYFDNLMAVFDHYTVIGAKITVKYRPSIAVGSVIPGTLGILLSDTGSRVSGASSITHLQEMKHQSKSLTVGNQTDKEVIVTKSYSPKKFFGKGWKLANSKYQGDASANPTENAFFEVWLASNGSNNPDGLNFDVCIDFIAHFSEPKAPAQS